MVHFNFPLEGILFLGLNGVSVA